MYHCDSRSSLPGQPAVGDSPVSLQLVTDPVSLQLVTDPVSPSSLLSSSDSSGVDLIYYFFDNCICISIM